MGRGRGRGGSGEDAIDAGLDCVSGGLSRGHIKNKRLNKKIKKKEKEKELGYNGRRPERDIPE